MTKSTVNYVPSFFSSVKYPNSDVVIVSSSAFTPQGDQFTLEFRTLPPNIIITTQSFNDLVVETSEVYPKKIVPPNDLDGSTVLLVATTTGAPTVAQNYYVPLRFERFKSEVVRLIDKQFRELTV